MGEIQAIGPHRLVYGDSLDWHTRQEALHSLPAPSALVLDPPLFAVYDDFRALFKCEHVLEVPRDIERNDAKITLRQFIVDFLHTRTGVSAVVVDPTAGHGTTVMACHMLDLVCVAIEFNKAHYDEMVKRVREFIG